MGSQSLCERYWDVRFASPLLATPAPPLIPTFATTLLAMGTALLSGCKDQLARPWQRCRWQLRLRHSLLTSLTLGTAGLLTLIREVGLRAVAMVARQVLLRRQNLRLGLVGMATVGAISGPRVLYMGCSCCWWNDSRAASTTPVGGCGILHGLQHPLYSLYSAAPPKQPKVTQKTDHSHTHARKQRFLQL